MSGGAYEYLYLSENLAGKEPYLLEVADKLEAAGALESAAKTREVLGSLARLKELQGELQNAWKAAEWVASGDWSEETLKRFK